MLAAKKKRREKYLGQIFAGTCGGGGGGEEREGREGADRCFGLTPVD